MTGSHRLARLASTLAAAATVCAQADITRQSTQAPAPIPVQDAPLTLQRALELFLQQNLDLAASAQDVRAAEALARQSAARPNPELELEVEDFGGTDDRRGFDAATTTARISLPLELGGKRSRRREVASAESRLASWEHEAMRRDKIAQTQRDFVDVLAAQERVALGEASLSLAEALLANADARVKAGKVSELERSKAEVEVSSARIERDRARRELEVHRRRLAANWGDRTARFPKAAGSLETLREAGATNALAANLELMPEVARWADEIAASQGRVAVEEANRTPVITLSAGVSRAEEDGSTAFIAGFSIPLPIFDRNAGNVDAAREAARGVEHRQRAARLSAETTLAEILDRIETARAEAVALRDTLLPAARQAFEAAQTGCEQGKFAFIDVIDAQRTLVEARTRLLDALANYHKAHIELERLTGAPFAAFDESNDAI